jgi:hypothetical protein
MKLEYIRKIRIILQVLLPTSPDILKKSEGLFTLLSVACNAAPSSEFVNIKGHSHPKGAVCISVNLVTTVKDALLPSLMGKLQSTANILCVGL